MAGINLDFFFLPALYRRNQQSCFQKYSSYNTPAKLNAILFVQHTLAVMSIFHTALACLLNTHISDIVFLQTTLLISCIVRVKIIKISSSRWWHFELATSAIKSCVLFTCSFLRVPCLCYRGSTEYLDLNVWHWARVVTWLVDRQRNQIDSQCSI